MLKSVRDVCDIGQMLFWGKKWVWYATAVMFVLNNTFIQVCVIVPTHEYETSRANSIRVYMSL